MKVIIKNWFVTWLDGHDGFMAPEIRRKAVVGQAYGDPDAPEGDGSEICIPLTQPAEIAPTISGRVITTADGKAFELGEPEPAYLKFLIDNGIGYDEAEPIKFVETLKHSGLRAERPRGGGRNRPGSN